MRRKIIALAIALTSATNLAVTIPATAQDAGSARWCSGGAGFFGGFEQARSILDSRYQRNGRVWQAPSDNAVWDEWCWMTSSKASMSNNVASPTRVIFSDGTVAVFRTTSLSGGYTIDLNSPSHSKNWKVHVR